MKTILDFAVWTLGLAIALPLYLQTEFLPRDADLVYFVVVLAMGLSLMSLGFGIWFRAHATKVLAQAPDVVLGADAETRFPFLKFGAAHSWFLGAALVLAFGVILYENVLPKPSSRECRIPLAFAGEKLDLIYDCGAAPEVVLKTGRLVQGGTEGAD